MEPYIIIPLLIVLFAVLGLAAEALRLQRENRRLRIECIVLDELVKLVTRSLREIRDDLEQDNRYDPHDESPTPERIE